MIDFAVGWLLANPLASVACLVVFAVGFGALLIPRVHEIIHHGHPRC